MPTPDVSWLDPQRRVALAELARLSSFTLAELDELVEDGTLVPLLGEPGHANQFNASWAGPLSEAARLRSERGLDLAMVSLLLGYLQRIAHLEHQLRALQPHFVPPQQLPREGPTPWREPHA